MSDPKPVPTLFEWMGGDARLKALFLEFYRRVPADSLLGPVFAGMDPHHSDHVAAFVGYLEWGSRLAVMNTAPGAEPPAPDIPMPTWNWHARRPLAELGPDPNFRPEIWGQALIFPASHS